MLDFNELKNLEEATLYQKLISLNKQDKINLINSIIVNKPDFPYRIYEIVAFVCIPVVNPKTEIEYYKTMGFSDKGAYEAQITDLYTGSQWDTLEDYLKSMKQKMTQTEFESEVTYWNDNPRTGLPRRTSGPLKISDF